MNPTQKTIQPANIILFLTKSINSFSGFVVTYRYPESCKFAAVVLNLDIFSGMATTLQSFIMIRSSCSLQEPSNGIAIFTLFYFSLVASLLFQTHSREQLCLTLDPWDSRKMPTNLANITSSTTKRLASIFFCVLGEPHAN